MEAGGKDHPPMLAHGNYVQRKSRIKRYINIKPNQELIYYCLQNPPYKFKWTKKTTPVAEAIERLKQGESINVQDLETNLYWEFGKFTSRDGESLESYYLRKSTKLPTTTSELHQTLVEHIRIILQESTEELGMIIRGHVAEECQKPKQAKDAAYHKEKMLLCKQDEAGIQLKVTPDVADNSRPIFDAEPLHKVQNDNDNYNVFDNDKEHPEQPESVNDTYLEEQCDTNITIDSLDMSTNGETVDQDDDDLAKERDLISSLIGKLKCEIDDSKNHNKLLELSNKTLVDKLKGEIEDFKNKNKSLESSNNHFKEANNELSKTNQLMFKDLKKFQAKLDRYHDVNYASKVEIDCAKAKGDLIFGKCECLEKELSKRNTMSKSFEALQKHVINLELALQQSQEQIKKDKALKENQSKVFLKEREQYFEIQDLKAQLQDKGIAINELKKLIEKMKGKYVETKFEKSSVIRQPNAFKSLRQSILGKVKFGKDQIASILGYGDLVQGNVTIKRVYYVEWLNHNLFSVGQFCDADLEVAFRKSTCYIRDLKGNDLLICSRGTDLYSITLQDTSTPNPICLMAKALSSQAWLWHPHLSYLNFDTINLLSKYNIVTGHLKLKFFKDHLCSSCELGKAKHKIVHKEDFTLKLEGIEHQTSTARTPEQNCVVERRNRTLIEAA
ncbi:retrovirus-related pol polyprotein from transposon TNT 1-94 [Tanacetum coccineum]